MRFIKNQLEGYDGGLEHDSQNSESVDEGNQVDDVKVNTYNNFEKSELGEDVNFEVKNIDQDDKKEIPAVNNNQSESCDGISFSSQEDDEGSLNSSDAHQEESNEFDIADFEDDVLPSNSQSSAESLDKQKQTCIN